MRYHLGRPEKIKTAIHEKIITCGSDGCLLSDLAKVFERRHIQRCIDALIHEGKIYEGDKEGRNKRYFNLDNSAYSNRVLKRYILAREAENQIVRDESPVSYKPGRTPLVPAVTFENKPYFSLGFTERDLLEEVIFQYSNRIGATILYVALWSKLSKNQDTDLLNDMLSDIVRHASSDFLYKFGPRCDWKTPPDDRQLMEAFARIYPIFYEKLSKITYSLPESIKSYQQRGRGRRKEQQQKVWKCRHPQWARQTTEKKKQVCLECRQEIKGRKAKQGN